MTNDKRKLSSLVIGRSSFVYHQSTSHKNISQKTSHRKETKQHAAQHDFFDVLPDRWPGRYPLDHRYCQRQCTRRSPSPFFAKDARIRPSCNNHRDNDNNLCRNIHLRTDLHKGCHDHNGGHSDTRHDRNHSRDDDASRHDHSAGNHDAPSDDNARGDDHTTHDNDDAFQPKPRR